MLGSAMAKKKEPGMPTGEPFDIIGITQEIERQRKRHRLSVKEIAEQSGIGVWSWYKKAALEVEFDPHDWGKIAKALRAPKWWPVIPWDLAVAIERLLEKSRG